MKGYSKKFLLDLYRSMMRMRLFEESLVEPILNKTIQCPCHLYSGEEAIAAGICASLLPTDMIFGNHRSHGHYLAKGGQMNELAAEIYCKETGCSHGRGGSMHVIDTDVGMMGSAPIVAGTISLALGAALASSIRKDGRVTVVFFGDGASGEGVLYESLNFASLKNLPIIFVCENNFYATHMPILECRNSKSVKKIAESFEIENHSLAGNEIIKVYEAGREAVLKCRKGNGPIFLEFSTYRFRGHVGPDDNIQGTHTDVRPPDELKEWLKKDPLILFSNSLLKEHSINQKDLDNIEFQAINEVEQAHEFAKKSPVPMQEELMKNVYR